MTRRGLAWLFVLALPLASLATFPLRLALASTEASRLGLAAAAVHGSVWHGGMHATTWHGRTLGDLRIRLQPWPLLTGVRALRVEGATLRARLVHGRRTGLDGVDGTLLLASLPAVVGLDLRLDAHDVRMLFDGQGCSAASGRLDATLLRPGEATPLAELAGAARCDGQAARIELAARPGQDGFAGATATLRIHRDGAWDLEAHVADAAPATRALLAAAGFQPGPGGGWSQLRQGRFAPP